ncbi:hypothetical protein AB833_32360 [Chromatiales bacterium (ex Bugula neritina AB1)]|nr:hypothetical protein AB833_32360 [Chromatiales bacterium (ex Bugula neritina AB1)]
MRRAPESIWNFISPIVEGLHYNFVGVSLGQAESGLTLRVYIDHEDGITVDDCGRVSNVVSAGLDVEELLSGEYCLEVSSPGLERPLFNAGQFSEQIGRTVKARLLVPQDGRRNFTGVLEQVEGDEITLAIDGESYNLAIRDIDNANLVAQFGRG